MFTSAEEKRAFTRDLFSRLAPRYELLNALMSLGQVERWRRAAAKAARIPPGGRALDVAAGEGGLTRALVARWSEARVVAVDFTHQMVRLGRARTKRRVHWAEGDALRLPFPDATFDAVVNAFMLRNVVDVEGALAEQVRVVRPGGRVVCLEMTWPRSRWFRPLFRLYFFGWVPLLGGLLTGQRDAYRYLPRSVHEFLPPEGVAATMERVGLGQVQYRLMGMGTVALYVGKRNP